METKVVLSIILCLWGCVDGHFSFASEPVDYFSGFNGSNLDIQQHKTAVIDKILSDPARVHDRSYQMERALLTIRADDADYEPILNLIKYFKTSIDLKNSSSNLSTPNTIIHSNTLLFFPNAR